MVGDGPMVVRARAHAKVNLCLEVLGTRGDGFHEVATVLQALALADELAVEEAEGLSLICDDPGLAGPDNLALRAAEALQREAGVRRGARIALAKRIPVAAGLGGGSADAAAALLALDRLWGTRLGQADLMRLGGGLGSDVPFFLSGAGTALSEGRGDRVTALGVPMRRDAWAVVLVPPVYVPERKTAYLYGLLRPKHYNDGCRARAWVEGLNAGVSWSALAQEPGIHNAFEAVAAAAYPGIEAAWGAFRGAAAPAPVHLSGAGPALFSFFPDARTPRRVHAALRARGLRALLTETASLPVDLEG